MAEALLCFSFIGVSLGNPTSAPRFAALFVMSYSTLLLTARTSRTLQSHSENLQTNLSSQDEIFLVSITASQFITNGEAISSIAVSSRPCQIHFSNKGQLWFAPISNLLLTNKHSWEPRTDQIPTTTFWCPSSKSRHAPITYPKFGDSGRIRWKINSTWSI